MVKEEKDARSFAREFLSSGEIKESRRVVVALMKTEEVEVVIDFLKEKYEERPDFRVEDHGTFYRLDAEEGFEVDLDEVEPYIGRSYNVYDFLVSVSTTIGRAYTVGNKFVITTDLIGIERPMPVSAEDDQVR